MIAVNSQLTMSSTYQQKGQFATEQGITQRMQMMTQQQLCGIWLVHVVGIRDNHSIYPNGSIRVITSQAKWNGKKEAASFDQKPSRCLLNSIHPSMQSDCPSFPFHTSSKQKCQMLSIAKTPEVSHADSRDLLNAPIHANCLLDLVIVIVVSHFHSSLFFFIFIVNQHRPPPTHSPLSLVHHAAARSVAIYLLRRFHLLSF